MNQLSKTVSKMFSRSLWLGAALTASTVVGLATLLLTQLVPEFIASIVSNGSYFIIFVLALTTIFFLIAAVSFSMQLRTERQLSTSNRTFFHDGKGTLFNDGEVNIAIRIKTFKLILEHIDNISDAERLRLSLRESGLIAPLEFAENIEMIYERDVREQFGKKSWDQLSLQEKLNEWAAYDRNTGWGIISPSLKENEIVVKVAHFHELFSDRGGEIFAHFLAGYCELLISHLIRRHTTGRFIDIHSVSLQLPLKPNELGVTFHYELQ